MISSGSALNTRRTYLRQEGRLRMTLNRPKVMNRCTRQRSGTARSVRAARDDHLSGSHSHGVGEKHLLGRDIGRSPKYSCRRQKRADSQGGRH